MLFYRPHFLAWVATIYFWLKCTLGLHLLCIKVTSHLLHVLEFCTVLFIKLMRTLHRALWPIERTLYWYYEWGFLSYKRPIPHIWLTSNKFRQFLYFRLESAQFELSVFPQLVALFLAHFLSLLFVQSRT